jgi:hypothetical protein
MSERRRCKAIARCTSWMVALVIVSISTGAHAQARRPSKAAVAEPEGSSRDGNNVFLQVGGVALVVAGVGLLGTAVVFELRAESKWTDIESAAERGGPWTPALQSTHDAARVDQLVGGLLLAGGATLAVLGAVAYAQGSPSVKRPSRSAARWLDAAHGRLSF